MWEQFRNWLYLIVFKPHRFFDVRPFESNQIEAIRLFKITSNCIDYKDCPSEPAKGAITDHPYATAYVMQRSEDANQRGLVRQATHQDRQRSAFRIVFVLDRHVDAIVGTLLIQGAYNTDPVPGRVKQTGA